VDKELDPSMDMHMDMCMDMHGYVGGYLLGYPKRYPFISVKLSVEDICGIRFVQIILDKSGYIRLS
jgi:hypothetical protein